MSAEYTSKVPVHDIDLAAPEADRWALTIRQDRAVARRLAQQALADMPGSGILGWLMGNLYGLSGGRYVDEIKAWAPALDLSEGEGTLVQCSYEMSHLGGYLFGCTAGVLQSKHLGMVHVRSMDWPLRSLGAATRVFRFHQGKREFIAVGIAGFVGVLSGMVPGAYSVTINWAPPSERPGFDFGPAFLLREVLETCDTYEEAVKELKGMPLSAPVFFTVCGATAGQACVIERTRADAAVRKFTSSVLVQANHHVSRKFVDLNEHFAEVENSQDRARVLEQELLERVNVKSLDEVADSLDAEPVCNEDSHQQMVFCPGAGEYKVWRR